MSLWFRRRDKQGRVHYYSINVPFLFLVVMAILAILISLCLPFLQWLRSVAQ